MLFWVGAVPQAVVTLIGILIFVALGVRREGYIELVSFAIIFDLLLGNVIYFSTQEHGKWTRMVLPLIFIAMMTTRLMGNSVFLITMLAMFAGLIINNAISFLHNRSARQASEKPN